MPYQWTETPKGPVVLTLSAHNSLEPKGFALMVGITAGLIALPLMSVLGTVIVWALLPFLGFTVWALWFALRRNQSDRQISEILSRDEDELTLVHSPARGPDKKWTCNVYWAKAGLIEKGGPVDYYVTLSGGGRVVEIGRFLSEDERKTLFAELATYLKGQQ